MNRLLIHFLLLSVLVIACNTSSGPEVPGTQMTREDKLAVQPERMGHRNWILVLDKAFPEQEKRLREKMNEE